jgi:hypothetical protein
MINANFCPRCGRPASINGKFCTGCGVPFAPALPPTSLPSATLAAKRQATAVVVEVAVFGVNDALIGHGHGKTLLLLQNGIFGIVLRSSHGGRLERRCCNESL